MKRPTRQVLRVSAAGAALLLVLAVTWVFLSVPDPYGSLRNPGGLLGNLTQRRSVGGRQSETSAIDSGSAHPRAAIPLFSEDWFDDSGFSMVALFMAPPTDPSSLEEVRAGLSGAPARGIKQLEQQMPGLIETPRDREIASRLNLIIGSLLMYQGDFPRAARRYEEALRDEPTGSVEVRANIQALIGVAALRRGETENCVACRNEASCLFPLAPEAWHRKPEGSREAIRRFTQYLDQRPEDLGVRWLLNLAHMTLGEYPEKVSPRFLIPPEMAAPEPAVGRFLNVGPRVGLDAMGPNMAGGCIADDFNNDGLIDVFFSTSDPDASASLLINQGDGRFEARDDSAGLSGQVAALNAIQGDFDNDGHLDVLLLRGAWEMPRRPSLLRNTGGGVFEDVTIAAGLASPIASQAAAWADFDRDGWLDLYIAGEYEPDRNPDPRNRGRLYRNNRDGTFADISDSAGVRNDRFAKGVTWGDTDNDGDPDLFISNLGQPNRLYRNNADGTFTDIAEWAGVTEPINGFACWFWDFDNDGKLDLYVNPYSAKLPELIRSRLGEPTTGERPRLFHNEGQGLFRDVTRAFGLTKVVIPMGANLGDIDNDGYLDMYLGTGRPPYSYLVPNLLYRNVGGLKFEDVTTATGTGHLQKGHGVAFADWDHDGDSDLFLEAGGATPGDKAGNLLFQNPGGGGHWLNLRLVGTTSNRSAIGARVTVGARMPDGSISERHRLIGPGGSFGGNPLATTIGLGEATAIASLRIVWPSGKSEDVFMDLPTDRAIEVTEGSNAYRTLDWKPITLPESVSLSRHD